MTPSPPPHRPWLKLLAGLIAIGLGAIGLRTGASQFNLSSDLQSVLLWVQSLGGLGPIGFIGVYILATVLFLPGSLLTLGGGAIFGIVWGSVYVFVAATLGATLAFLIGRYLVRNWVQRQLESNPKFSVIDRAIAQQGFKIVLLTRLSPVFPFSLLNYALSITQVSLRDYILGSIGMLPGTIMYVYLGSLAGDLVAIEQSTDHTQAQTLQWSLRLVGLVATGAVTLYVTRIARQALGQLDSNP
jgi:uncharacterized membrane protein YdjX (TVP38/TMEM64 family)